MVYLNKIYQKSLKILERERLIYPFNSKIRNQMTVSLNFVSLMKLNPGIRCKYHQRGTSKRKTHIYGSFYVHLQIAEILAEIAHKVLVTHEI